MLINERRILAAMIACLVAAQVGGCGDMGQAYDDRAEIYERAGSSVALKMQGNNGSPSSVFPLGLCEGDCDKDSECAPGLKCFQRDTGGPVPPGCSGTPSANNDYCYADGPSPKGNDLRVMGNNGVPSSVFPLGLCEGDCDGDSECAPGLRCFNRDAGGPVPPGCSGTPEGNRDYCYKVETNENPDCMGGAPGEDPGKKENGTLTFNGQQVAYELRGGVIRKKHSANACVQTAVRSGQTQVVMMGTSDGGDTSKKKNQPIDRELMQRQGFILISAVGDQDARSEVWLRVFKGANAVNWKKTVAISGMSNAVAWVIATVDTELDASRLSRGVVSTGGGMSLKNQNASWGDLDLGSYQRSQFQFKLVSGFLDDSCQVDEQGEDSHMISFWKQGDGDTFFAGIWGAGESVQRYVRMKRLEDWGFDVAVIAAGQNP